MNRRAAEVGEAKIAVVGAGYVGTSIVNQLVRAPAMRPALVVNRTPDRAIEAYKLAGFSADDVVVSNNVGELADAINAGKPAYTESYEPVASLPIDIMVEATGALDYGARAILASLDAGQDVVSFNAEIDGLLAYTFHERAKASGAVYSIADGDQPGVILRVMQDIAGWGFHPTVALNCKRHLNVHQTPDSGAAFSERDKTSAIMTTSFGDGTKMQVEMAVVANATGMIPDVRGMHGIRTMVEKAAVDIPAAITSAKMDGPGVVDFTHEGDFAAGIGVVARHETHDLIETPMRFYKMGDGPDYFFFRPFHLVHLELPLTLADVILDHEPLATVDAPHVSEVVAMAKKDLTPGEELDCIGGFTAYGLVDTAQNAAGYLPIGLVQYAKVTGAMSQDDPISLDNVELDESVDVVKLWRAQLEMS